MIFKYADVVDKCLDNMVLYEEHFPWKGCPWPGVPTDEESISNMQLAISTIWADLKGSKSCCCTLLSWKVIENEVPEIRVDNKINPVILALAVAWVLGFIAIILWG